MKWIVQVAEQKIIEHRLLKKYFNNHEEFIIFTIAWIRIYRSLILSLKNNKTNISKENFIKNFYNNQNNQYLGMTINGITRESKIPRSTVKRIIEKLIAKKLLIRNNSRLIIPSMKVREYMSDYRKFIYTSNKKLLKLFDELDLDKFDENENL